STGFPPVAGAGDQRGIAHVYLSLRVGPWRMPNAEESRAIRLSSESRVALEQELRERFGIAGFEFFAEDVSFINQPTISGLDAPAKRLAIARVVVVDAGEVIRQTEAARAE